MQQRMVSKNFLSRKSLPLYHAGAINIRVMSEQQKQEAQYIWETNIDGDTYIDNPDDISDKLVLIDSGTGL